MLLNDKVFEFELRAAGGAKESRVDTQLNPLPEDASLTMAERAREKIRTGIQLQNKSYPVQHRATCGCYDLANKLPTREAYKKNNT